MIFWIYGSYFEYFVWFHVSEIKLNTSHFWLNSSLKVDLIGHWSGYDVISSLTSKFINRYFKLLSWLSKQQFVGVHLKLMVIQKSVTLLFVQCMSEQNWMSSVTAIMVWSNYKIYSLISWGQKSSHVSSYLPS